MFSSFFVGGIGIVTGVAVAEILPEFVVPPTLKELEVSAKSPMIPIAIKQKQQQAINIIARSEPKIYLRLLSNFFLLDLRTSIPPCC
jgi:hypothetical protein